MCAVKLTRNLRLHENVTNIVWRITLLLLGKYERFFDEFALSHFNRIGECTFKIECKYTVCVLLCTCI